MWDVRVYLDGVLLLRRSDALIDVGKSALQGWTDSAFDEPTAALDPIAENDIYMKYSEMTRGKTSMFISHRLASTRFCDRIIFVADGGVKEEGTHESLFALGGEYANLFEVQSRYYQEGKRSSEYERKSNNTPCSFFSFGVASRNSTRYLLSSFHFDIALLLQRYFPLYLGFLSAQILTELATLRRADILWKWVIAGVLCVGVVSILKAFLQRRYNTLLNDLWGRKEILFIHKMFSLDFQNLINRRTMIFEHRSSKTKIGPIGD